MRGANGGWVSEFFLFKLARIRTWHRFLRGFGFGTGYLEMSRLSSSLRLLLSITHSSSFLTKQSWSFLVGFFQLSITFIRLPYLAYILFLPLLFWFRICSFAVTIFHAYSGAQHISFLVFLCTFMYILGIIVFDTCIFGLIRGSSLCTTGARVQKMLLKGQRREFRS